VAYQVIVGRIAQRELAKIHDYIAKSNPVTARAFTEKLVREAKSNGLGKAECKTGLKIHPLIVFRK
jgi:plasmid stabilization system protein ParE